MEKQPDSPDTESKAAAGPSIGPAALEAERHRLQVKVTKFEGPLDLLLYDEYLEVMRQLDLNIAGEFLVMAATLAYIKSRSLLPRTPSEEGEDAEDPRRALAESLLEHQRFLLAAESLGARGDVQEAYWTRPPSPREDLGGEVTMEATLFDLVRSFRSLLESVGASKRIDLSPDGISVEARMAQVLDELDRDKMVDFQSLFPAGSRKLDLIITFLALLELIRLQMIAAWQGRRFAGIRITRRVQPATETSPTDSEIPSEVEGPELTSDTVSTEELDPLTADEPQES